MTDLPLQLLRFAVLALLVAGVASLSDWPLYRSVPEGTGVLTLSFSHGADRKAACRKLSAEEIADLPPNMRRTEVCPRERPPVYVELDVDGERLYAAELPPTGIAGDGNSRAYQRFRLPAGRHAIAVRLRDRPGTTDFGYTAERTIELESADHKVIDFRPEAGGFVFH